MNPVGLLAFSAAAQILVSSLLGVVLLIPMQPWGRRFHRVLPARPLLQAHVDWLMLAFMELGAAWVLDRFPVGRAPLVAVLLVFGGWTNAMPYLVRGYGIDAFVLGGPWPQRVAATIAGVSAAAIIVAWALVVTGLWPHVHLRAG